MNGGDRGGSVACPAVTSQAAFLNTDVEVSLGTTTTEQLVIINDGDEDETYRLSAAGLAGGWATLRPSTVTVPPHSQELVEVEIHPPRLPSTSVGSTGLIVRVAPQRPDATVLEAGITLDVQPVHERRVSLLQPAQRGRHGATYELTVDNRGNTQASCRLRFVDPTGRTEGEFEPPAVGVDAGGTTLARLKVRSTSRQWERRRRTLPFRIEAEQNEAPTVTTTGTFVQTPMLPEHLVGWLVGAVAVLAVLVGGWFGVVKPAIRDAADDAVAESAQSSTPPQVADSVLGAVTTTIAVTTSTTAAPTPSTTVATSGTTVPGELFARRMSKAVAPGGTDEDTYTVPDGQILRLTDFVVQNPNSDRGIVSVAIGDEPLLSWSLDYVLPSDSRPFISPIEVPGGTIVHFSVTCLSVGQSTATSGECQPSLTISGRLSPT